MACDNTDFATILWEAGDDTEVWFNVVGEAEDGEILGWLPRSEWYERELLYDDGVEVQDWVLSNELQAAADRVTV